jgi:hypothetical protein
MCEELSGERAQVTSVPTWLLRTTRSILKSMDWSRDAADRLVRRGRGLRVGAWNCMPCSLGGGGGSKLELDLCPCLCFGSG